MSEFNYRCAPVVPYLTVKGGQRALDFYCNVMGAKVLSKMPASESDDRIMHATLDFGGGEVMLSDEFSEYGGHKAPNGDDSPVAMSLRLQEAVHVDALHAAIIEAGGRSSHAPEDMFWGERFAQVFDPFGHRWMLAAPQQKDESA